MMKKALIVLSMTVFAFGLLTGCANSENESPSTPTENVKAGTPTIETTDDMNSLVYDINTTIMGEQKISKEKMILYYNVQAAQTRTGYPQYYIDRNVTLDDFVQMYIDEGTIEGVRPEMAFAQTLHETGYLQFGRQVSIQQFNFAGLGATDSNAAAGADFSTYGDNETGIRMGIRAQIQHLKGYASDESLVNECVDPRFGILEAAGKRNSAPLIGDLGCGNWAMDKDYASKILYILNEMRQ